MGWVDELTAVIMTVLDAGVGQYGVGGRLMATNKSSTCSCSLAISSPKFLPPPTNADSNGVARTPKTATIGNGRISRSVIRLKISNAVRRFLEDRRERKR